MPITRQRSSKTTVHRTAKPTHPEPMVSAAEAGLRYVRDDTPGMTRVRAGRGFRYLDASGAPVRDAATLCRFRALAVPPAWTAVWICPRADGHIQATGRDDRNRKQYRYHAQWREARDKAKYGRMVSFGRALPIIRERVAADLKRNGLPREKVLALLVQLLGTTTIRVGNDEYAYSNHSYGLSTMHDGHAKVEGDRIRFLFRGKSGVRHDIELTDRKLARLVRACQELPGQELFQYVDEEGAAHDLGSEDVNAYLREVSGQDFTAKDFRTWAGTVLAAVALAEFEAFDSEAQAKKNIVRAIESVAKRLGNTPTVCRKCYVHPEVLGSYLDGTMIPILKRGADAAMKDIHKLPPEESAVLALIQARLARESG